MKVSQMFNHWEQVRRDLLDTIDLFSEGELTFAPFEGSWSVGEIMLHIADCEDNWIHGCARHEIVPWVTYPLADHPTRQEIKDMLNRSRRKTVAFLDSLEEEDLDRLIDIPGGTPCSLGWILWHVLEHEIHHRGELSLALGLLGRQGLDV